MTRGEFIDTVEDFQELKFFCYQESIDICDNIIDSDYYDEIIMEEIRSDRFDTWQEIYHFLSSLPNNDGYYIEDENGEFSETTCQNFEDYKQMVLDYMDSFGDWDPEEIDEDEPEDEDYAAQNESAEEAESDGHEILDEEFFAVIRKAG